MEIFLIVYALPKGNFENLLRGCILKECDVCSVLLRLLLFYQFIEVRILSLSWLEVFFKRRLSCDVATL